MNKKILFLLVLLSTSVIIQTDFAQARAQEIGLLTVGEVNNQSVGGLATLRLEIRPGSGRVFIDSFPLTQLDTQISTRFGKQVACNFLQADCNSYDFFYTIRATTALVGGPSAGAATSVLTVAVLENIRLNPGVIMTGTINSGGIIGPVSGIEEKATAARNARYEAVLVPRWAMFEENQTNISGINVVPVSTLSEALFYFTNKDCSLPERDIVVPEQYTKIMGQISGDLCNRQFDMFEEPINQTKTQLENAQKAMERGDFYSAASFCFGANVQARMLLFENLTQQEKETIYDELVLDVTNFSNYINQIPLKTLSDLEASVIVKERILEAVTLLQEENAKENLAYIKERIFSAKAWSLFFDYESYEVELDQNFLNAACNSKMAEVEERINYFQFIAGTPGNYFDELDETRGIARSGDYAFCLFRATRIKADINSVLLSAMVRPETIEAVATEKVALARNQLANSNHFSILGYSYYDYAATLLSDNPRLSIVFSEYASEFTNLDMYFPSDQRRNVFSFTIDPYFKLGFFLGSLIGLSALFVVILVKNIKPRKAKRSPGKKR